MLSDPDLSIWLASMKSLREASYCYMWYSTLPLVKWRSGYL